MPAFSKPYRNLQQEKPIYKAELLREIAARTLIKENIVEEVLETFKQVATEEIANKGAFNFSGLFSVSSYNTKEVDTGKGIIPARRRLRARLSDRVKKVWNGRFRAGVTEPETYEEFKERYLQPAGNELRDSIGLLPPEKTEVASNPMLDDDDEY